MPLTRTLLAVAGLALALACGGGSSASSSSSPAGPPATPANPDGWTGARVLETSLALNSADPSVALDAAGDGFAVWQKQASSTANAVWGNQAASATGVWGTDADDVSTVGSAQDVRAASGGTGFWYAWDLTSDGSTYGVYAGTVQTGAAPAAPMLLSTGNSFYPAIAANASGAACIAWMVQPAAGFYQVWAALYAPGTGTWSAPIQISTTSTADAVSPLVGMDSAGNAVILWAEGVYANGGPYVTRLSASVPGSAWSAPATLSAADSQLDSYDGIPGQYALAMTDGGALAAWSESADGVTYAIRTARWSATTGLAASATVSATGGMALLPTVAQDAQGNAVAAWTTGATSQAPPTALVYAACPAQGAWQAPQTLVTSTLGLDNPVLAMNAAGAGVLAFNEADGYTWRVAAATSTSGSAFTTPVYIQTSTGGQAQPPVAATAASGQSLVVWTQADGAGLTHIYGNYYN